MPSPPYIVFIFIFAHVQDALSWYIYHGADRRKSPAFLAAQDIVITTYAIVGQEGGEKRTVRPRSAQDHAYGAAYLILFFCLHAAMRNCVCPYILFFSAKNLKNCAVCFLPSLMSEE